MHTESARLNIQEVHGQTATNCIHATCGIHLQVGLANAVIKSNSISDSQVV